MTDLKRLLKEISITQKQLSKELGVSQQAVSKVSLGEMKMPVEWVNHVEKKYNVDISDYDLSIISESPYKKSSSYLWGNSINEAPIC